MFHICNRVGLHEFLQIVNYDFSYQLGGTYPSNADNLG
jgi:hypothetical protein